MKKLIALCLVLALAATLFVGCGAKKPTLEGTPAELIEKIYAQKSVEFAPMTLTPDDPDFGAMWDWFYYTGLADGTKVSAAAVSEPMIGSIAFSLVVLRVNEGEDAKAVADLIKERFPNIDGEILINSVGTTIGSHTGPGTVALFYWGAKRED